MEPTYTKSVLFPNFTAQSVLDIEPTVLHELGITHIVFDLDRTLIPKRATAVEARYADYLLLLKQSGFQILIGSNTRRDIGSLIGPLGIPAITPRFLRSKPMGPFYDMIVKVAGTLPDHIAMVGDHVINDIVGGNRAGMTTILVKGMHGRLASRIYRPYFWALARRGRR
jgi:hypothetical protein